MKLDVCCSGLRLSAEALLKILELCFKGNS